MTLNLIVLGSKTSFSRSKNHIIDSGSSTGFYPIDSSDIMPLEYYFPEH